MKFFKFLKPKKNKIEEIVNQLNDDNFPNGEKDIDAGVNELLFILSNGISRAEAKSIFNKSLAISRIASNFDLERLKRHLRPYGLHHFNETQIDKYFNYLNALTMAMMLSHFVYMIPFKLAVPI
jgi:hypothetical protein